MKLQTIVLVLFAVVALVSGCATSDGRDDSRYGSVRSNEGYYAVIESIEPRPAANNRNAIVGAIIGGVIGGVAGHQVGSGRGNDVATVAGAAGDALVGHEIGQANERQDLYSIRVRFDDNSYQTVTQASLDGLRVGDSVRIERNRVRRY